MSHQNSKFKIKISSSPQFWLQIRVRRSENPVYSLIKKNSTNFNVFQNFGSAVLKKKENYVRFVMYIPKNHLMFKFKKIRKVVAFFKILRPFWVRYFEFWNFDFRFVFCDLKKPFIFKLKTKINVLAVLKILRSPFWIRHFEFWNFDIRFVYCDPKTRLVFKLKIIQ